MSTWIQQKRLAFDCFADYITCIHFEAQPAPPADDDTNSNNNNRRVEVLYAGCNNGLVLVSDISRINSNNNTNQSTPTQQEVDVSSSLSLLYCHSTTLSSSSMDSKSKNKNKNKKTSNQNQNENNNEEENIIRDEEFGATVFSISVYETILATCSEDGRCVISMLHDHPPFRNNNNNNNVSSSTTTTRLDKLTSLPKSCTQIPLLAVLDHQAACRCCCLFGGRSDYSSSKSNNNNNSSSSPSSLEESESSAVYCATGAEDGYFRIFRIDVGKWQEKICSPSSENNNNIFESYSSTKKILSWDDCSEFCSSHCDILYVVNCNCGILSATSSTLFSSSASSACASAAAAATSQQQQQQNNNNNSSSSYICTICFDEQEDWFIIGTQKSCFVVECLDSPQKLNNNSHLFIPAGTYRDTDHPATSDEWLNSTVFGLSPHRYISSSSSSSSSSSKKEININNNDDILNSPPISIPLRNLKPKNFVHLQNARSIGTVVDVAPMMMKIDDSVRKNEDVDENNNINNNNSNTNNQKKKKEFEFSQLQVMFPNLKQTLTLPQNAVRRVQLPIAVVAASGGPFFAISRCFNQNNSSSDIERKRRRCYLIAGASSSGEVELVQIQHREKNKIQQQQQEQENNCCGIITLCKFRVGNDLVKHISCLEIPHKKKLRRNHNNNSNHSSSTSEQKEEEEIPLAIVLCASYDGNISDWVLLETSSYILQEKQEEQEIIAIRRCLLHVSSSAILKSNEAGEKLEGKTNKSNTFAENLAKFPLLLGAAGSNDNRNSDNNETENDFDEISSSSASRVQVLDGDEEEENSATTATNNLNHKKIKDDKTITTNQHHRHPISSSSGVATLFAFAPAGIIFASCLFERVVQSFAFMETEGPHELPPGLVFNGFQTVKVNNTMNEGNDNSNNNDTRLPEELMEEGERMFC